MDIGLVGEGPAIEAAKAALGDIDVNVFPVDPDPSVLEGLALAVVAGTTGDGSFAAVDDVLDRWIAIEVGGIGGRPIESVDAAVTVFDGTCYECLRTRIRASDPDPADRPTGVRSAVRYAGALAGRRTIDLLSGGRPVGDTVVEVPGNERILLPVPGCSCGTFDRSRSIPREHEGVPLEDALERAQRAVDDRLGPIAEVGERESFPVPYYISRIEDTTPFSDVRAAEFAAGVDVDWNAAFMRALGEGLERYAAGVYREESFEYAPPDDLESPIPPDRFLTPDPVDIDSVGSIPWVEGERIDTGDRVSLPAEFVHFPPPSNRFRPSITTGLGLGSSGIDAVLSGLYETVERDATMIAWYSTIEPVELSIEDEGLSALEKRARAEGLSVTTLLATVDVDVPVVAAAVHREGDWPRFAAGSAADLDPAAAARSAVAESLQNWMELRAMGPEGAAAEGAAIGHHADFPAVTQSFFDPDVVVDAEGIGEPDLDGVAELEAVLDRLSASELTAYASRTTTRDVADLGFEAVRVLVPEAQPLFTGDPFFGERVQSIPESMGFEPDLEREYHPFP
ncbi:YcaO-like family protein [Halopenitus sp. H-Gu1]|uniref:YcaO-like family protein n=1 Tax=Halopenitus sp. H-Gu1 TaxID=3242697 RepID=UPI00359D98A7